MRSYFILSVSCFMLFWSLQTNVWGQNSVLQSGPMVGYSQMTEAALWAQTKEAAKVHFQYWEQGNAAEKMSTEAVQTNADQAFVAKVIAYNLEPGKVYDYEILVNDQVVTLPYPAQFQAQALWQWRTDPPNFKVALGSCTYVNETKYDRPGNPYGGEYEIFDAIHKMRPDVMLWTGDNIYLREVDWYSKSGILHRYTHTRSLPQMQALLASTHNYAIWDDHDFGPNDSDRSFILKDVALDAFELFWGNPTYGINGKPGTTSFFQFSDMEFFLLDNRYYRSPNRRKTAENVILGKEQMEWLIDALANSRAPFKFVVVGGQVLNTHEGHENFINCAPEERTYIMKRIEEEGIKNVIFLTGDRHHSELSMYKNAVGNLVYDLTVSPLTSGAARNPETDNQFRVDNTLVKQRNFGILEFSGPRTARKMKVTLYDVQGKELWSKEISAE